MRGLLLPFRSTPLVLVAVFTVMIGLSMHAGIVGLPLGALIVSWFFKYCFVLFDAALAGTEPPVLSAEMVNPWNEPRPLTLMLMMLVYAAALGFLVRLAGEPGVVAGIVLWVACFPAIVSLLGMTRNPFRALHPPGIVALIRGIGMDYLWILIGACAAVGTLYALVPVMPSAIGAVLLQLAFLEFFAAIGGAMNEHRVALGFDTLTADERREARDRMRHVAERDAMLARAYAQVRLHKPADAWRELEAWIGVHGEGHAAWVEWSALLTATARWDHPAIADRLASLCASRLVASGETGHALEVTERRLAQNPAFLPTPPALAARLAELASLAGKRAMQRRLAARDDSTAAG